MALGSAVAGWLVGTLFERAFGIAVPSLPGAIPAGDRRRTGRYGAT